MEKQPEFHVKIGEIKIGKSQDILKATLGSCVGIAFVWKDKNRFGLAHCLLPDAPASSLQLGAKYVSQAIPSLIAMMKLAPENFSELEVYVTGGGNMLERLAKKNSNHVGVQNADTAKRILKEMGFPLTQVEVGGDEGRQIIVDCATAKIQIRKIPRTTTNEKSR